MASPMGMDQENPYTPYPHPDPTSLPLLKPLLSPLFSNVFVGLTCRFAFVGKGLTITLYPNCAGKTQ